MLRRKNEGMDFAGYGLALHHWKISGLLSSLKHIIFINSSTRGPILPPWFTGHWTSAFTSLLSDDVWGVASSIACLPEVRTSALPLVRVSPSHVCRGPFLTSLCSPARLRCGDPSRLRDAG